MWALFSDNEGFKKIYFMKKIIPLEQSVDTTKVSIIMIF